MNNKEKLLALASGEETQTVKRAKARIERRKYTRLSKKIAFIILARLDELGWKQVQLAKKMGVSAQQVNKWVKGNENFTIETLFNLGEALCIDIIQIKPLQEKGIMEEYQMTMSSDYETLGESKHIPTIVSIKLESEYEEQFAIAE